MQIRNFGHSGFPSDVSELRFMEIDFLYIYRRSLTNLRLISNSNEIS